MTKFNLSLKEISDILIEHYKRKGYFGINCTFKELLPHGDRFEGIIEVENTPPHTVSENTENSVKAIKYGEVQRKILSIEAPYYNFDSRFSEYTNWIDETIDVLSMTPIEVKRDDSGIKEKYLVIYREII